MEKNWLIRTQSHKILGPVSREKIIELVQKKSLASDDEICPGNGFWFFIREKDLLDEYLMGDHSTCFNPVSEAPSRVSGHDYNWIDNFLKQMESGKNVSRQAPANSPAADVTLVKNLNDFKAALKEDLEADKKEESHHELFPSQDDLEYPDLENKKDPTMPSIPTISVASLHERRKDDHLEFDDESQEESIKLPESTDLEYPDLPEVELSLEIKTSEENTPPKPAINPPKNNLKKPMPKPLNVSSSPLMETEKVALEAKLSISTVNNKDPVAEKPPAKKPIDPMVLLQVSQTASRPPVKTKRNDHYLVLAFVVILGVIGFLFYQYKQMVKKTMTARQAQQKVLQVAPLQTPEALPTATDTSPSPQPQEQASEQIE